MIRDLFEISLSKEEKDKLVEKIKDGIETREYPERIVSFEEFVQELNSTITPTDISEYKQKMDYLNSKWDIHAFRKIKSHRKILGPIIIFYKRIARKLLKFYIEPITDDQRDFNQNNVVALKYIEHYMEQQENKNDQLISLMNNNYKDLLDNIQKLDSENKTLQRQYSNVNDYIESSMNTLQVALEEKLQTNQDEVNNHYIRWIENVKEERVTWEQEVEVARDNVSCNTERLNKLEEELLQVRQLLDQAPLNRNDMYDKKSYAQSGEDTILTYIFSMLQMPIEQITYIDLGANHAKEMSNTYFFYNQGVKGVLVEANKELVKELKYYRHRDVILNKAIAAHSGEQLEFYVLNGDGLSTLDKENATQCCEINEELAITEQYTVETITVEEIIENYLGQVPTFISIDIEGKEMDILQSIDFNKYRPKVIIVETIPYQPYLGVQMKNGVIIDYMRQQEYEEYAFTGINSIFIDKRILKNR